MTGVEAHSCFIYHYFVINTPFGGFMEQCPGCYVMELILNITSNWYTPES